MLQGDPAQRIAHLMAERYPVYGLADVTVMSRDVAHETIVNRDHRSGRRAARPRDVASAGED